MSDITLSQQQKTDIVEKLQQYFMRELDTEIGQFDAEFLLDFFSEKVGVYFYNQGLQDAQAALSLQLDNINEAIELLEKPVER